VHCVVRNLSFNTISGSLSAWDQPTMFASLTELCDLHTRHPCQHCKPDWMCPGTICLAAVIWWCSNYGS